MHIRYPIWNGLRAVKAWHHPSGNAATACGLNLRRPPTFRYYDDEQVKKLLKGIHPAKPVKISDFGTQRSENWITALWILKVAPDDVICAGF